MKYALIDETGAVDNIIIWDGENNIFDSEKCIKIGDTEIVGVGYIYTGSSFSPPEEIESS
ncbi:hypothetical protein [Bacillus altitudinis]|uniref:hypothetical protein n=1 Tax=Bacillus altitudinis TaxID=293387 RepID=UPI00366F79A9